MIGFEPWMEFPFNQGKLCPKGVKRYLQGAHPDRLLQRYRARSGRAGRRSSRSATRPPSRASRPRSSASKPSMDPRHRPAQRRQPDDREGLPDGQVRARLPEDAVHRLQRPPVHGQRRRRATRRPSASIVPANPWSDILEGGGRLDQRREHRRVRAHHHRLRLAGARERRQRSSSSIRASPPIAVPATSSCRSSRAATWRCSTAFCI